MINRCIKKYIEQKHEELVVLSTKLAKEGYMCFADAARIVKKGVNLWHHGKHKM